VTSTQLAIAAAGLALLALYLLAERRLRPHFFVLLFLGANIADYHFFVSSWGIGVTSRIKISDLLLLGAVAVWLVRRQRAARLRTLRPPWPPLTKAVAAYMIIGGLSIVRGMFVEPLSALGEGRFVIYPLVYFCAFDAALAVHDVRRPIRYFVALTLLVGLIGGVVFLGTGITSLKDAGFPGRIGAYAVFAVVFLGSGLLPGDKRRQRGAMALLGALIVFSGLRQALVLIPLAILVYRRHLGRGVGRILAPIAAVAAVFLIVALTFTAGPEEGGRGTVAVYQSAVTDPVSDSSVDWRLTYWERLIATTPPWKFVVGIGIYSYFDDLELPGFYGQVSATPHNSFLVMLLYGGVPLFFAYFYWVFAAGRRYASRAWVSDPALERLAGIGLFLVVSFTLMLGFNAEHRTAGLWPMMWGLLGFIDAMMLRHARSAQALAADAEATSAAPVPAQGASPAPSPAKPTGLQGATT
jgi:hypothetical protein